MATIPLPALHTAPIEQPASPLATYAQMMGIKNAQQELQQRQTMAPLQQQEAQQAVQSGQVDLQQKQQALTDQQTFRAAMQEPANHGKTLGDIADTLASKGAISMQGWQGMKKADIDQRTALATLDEKGLANAAAAHKQTQELYNNAMDMPDEQLAANWPSIAQQYDAIPGNNKQPLDPQQPLTKQQLQQFGPMLAMHGAYLDEATQRQQKQTELQTSKATLAQKQAESQFYTDNGGAPGVSADLMQQSDWLKNNPGKGPSDYLLWKNQHAPAVVVQNMNNAAAAGSANEAGGGASNGAIDWGKAAQRYGMTPQAFDQTAEKYFSTGQLPPIGRSPNAIAMNRDLMNRAAELHPDASLAANSAEFKANADSLKKLQTNFDQVQAFESTAEKNIDLLQETAKKIPDLGTRFANYPVRMITGSIVGTDSQAAFKTALNTAQTEAAKVLNSSNASGILSDSARHELQELVDGNLPYSAMVASLNTLKQDMGNRRVAYQGQIDDIKGRLKGAAQPSAGGGQPKVGDTKAFPNGSKGVWDGHGWVAQ